MDAERGLISKIIQSGDLDTAIARGIELDHFADEECEEIYDFLLDHWRKYKSTATAKVVRKEFPDFKVAVDRNTLPYFIDQFVTTVKEREAIDLVRDFHEALEDPEQINEIELVALEMARKLVDVVPAPRVKKFSEGLERIKEYDKRKKEGMPPGVMMGIPSFDRETLGAQPHELVTVVAYLGVGKSKLLQHVAYSAYLQKKTAVYISLEMEAEAILRSLDTMATNFKYHSLKALELDIGDREQWEKLAEQAHEDRHERDIYIIDDIRNCTVDNVAAKLLRYKPDVVITDYMELMRTPKGIGGAHWEQVQYTTQGLKQNARLFRVPHISAAQLNREGGKGEASLANVSYQSVGKDSDLLIGLNQDEEDEAQQEMKAMLLKNRDGRKTSTKLRWQLERHVIQEKGVAERFPERNDDGKLKNPKFKGRKTRREQDKLQVADELKGEDNPWKPRKRMRGSARAKPRSRSLT